MSAPPPPAYLFINVMRHLRHTREPGRLNNCRAIPHRLARVGRREECFEVKMLRSEYICGISGMEERFTGEWERDPHAHSVILVIKAWNGFITVLIGRIVLHRLSETRRQTSHFFLSLGNVLFCPLVLIAVWFSVKLRSITLGFHRFIDEHTLQ